MTRRHLQKNLPVTKPQLLQLKKLAGQHPLARGRQPLDHRAYDLRGIPSPPLLVAAAKRGTPLVILAQG